MSFFNRLRKPTSKWDEESKSHIARGESYCPGCYRWSVISDAVPDCIAWRFEPKNANRIATCAGCVDVGIYGVDASSGEALLCGEVCDWIPRSDGSNPNITLTVNALCLGNFGRNQMEKGVAYVH